MPRLATLFLLLLVLTEQAVTAATRYVRKDGHSSCTGLNDAAWDTVCTSNCPCAKATIGSIKSDVAAGDTLLIQGGNGPYLEQVAWMMGYASETTIKGYGSEKPVIGRITTIADPNWTLHDSATKTYKRDWTVSGELTTAYLVPYTAYENERIGLVLYESLAWLMAPPLSPSADPNDPYYIGPGVWADDANNKLYIRLDADTDPNTFPGGPVYDYQGSYVPLYIGAIEGSSENPDDFTIKVSTDAFTFSVDGSHYTFDNLVIEGTVELCPTVNYIEEIKFTNNKIWASKRGAIRTFSQESPAKSCSSRNITIGANYILWDIPYWVSWADSKGSIAETGRLAAYPDSPNSLITLNDDADSWTIERNLIRGGHDGIGSNGKPIADPNVGGNTDDIIIRYNRIEHFQDDPIEIEGEHLGEWKVYGNFISNSLNCLSSGQQTTDFVGPVYYYSNICVLLRPPFIARPGQAVTWNGGFAYGNQHAFKMEDTTVSPENRIHLYNNTTILGNSDPEDGMDFISGHGKSKGMEFFNNIFIKVNGRVGERWYPDTADVGDPNKPSTVNWNLYRSLNNDPNTDPNNAYLLDLHNTVASCYADTNGCKWEQNGLGMNAQLPVGTDPELLEEWGWGCMDPETAQCNGFDESTGARWSVRPGSQWWDPATLVPGGSSPLCNVGRGTVPSAFPVNGVTPTGAFDPNSIGAIPCGVTESAFDYFPMNAGWKTTQLSSGQAPQVTITSPSSCPVSIEIGQSVTFCGTFDSDADGGAPMKVVWDFTGGNCPLDESILCPGSRTFTGAGTCVAQFYVMDRWGFFENPIPTCSITVSGGGGGSCSDCSRCICEQF